MPLFLGRLIRHASDDILHGLDDMREKEGTLRMMASSRWAVYRAGRLPVEITSGELFRVEVAGVNGLH
jgi:hypothetical protein